jgi:peptidoglycan/LPS O-acetylase OafA/YrhL
MVLCVKSHEQRFFYRADIDGLRALAVGLVVAFHALPSQIPGGFIGVDVFFVISGFLITKILITEIEGGHFSLAGFYRRRIARIFPALILVLFFTLTVGSFFFYAEEYKSLGLHVLGGAFFFPNLLLLSEVSYFGAVSAYKPLLHLWSLGVEEQFYLIWPLIISWLVRHRRPHVAILVITTISIVIFFCLGVFSRDWAFYFPLGRIWELAAGGSLALARGKTLGLKAKVWSPILEYFEQTGATLGLVFILLGSVLISQASTPLVVSHVIPVIGAILIIVGVKDRIGQLVLQHRWMVTLGLISYPLYLWHWPLLSFANYFYGTNPAVGVRAGLVVVAIALASLTYWFVERPVLSRQPNTLHAWLLVLSMVIVGIIGASIYLAEGIRSRSAAYREALNAGDIGESEYRRYLEGNFNKCESQSIFKNSPVYDGVPQCYQSKKGRVDVAIIGDSHADHLFPGIATALKDMNVAAYWQGASKDRGLPVLSEIGFEAIFNQIVASTGPKTVIISANWNFHIKSRGGALAVASELDNTARTLIERGIRVIVLYDVPTFGFDPTICKYGPRGGTILSVDPCVMQRKDVDQQQQPVILMLEQLVGLEVDTLFIVDTLCDQDRCFMARDKMMLYRDPSHLSIAGSLHVGNYLKGPLLKSLEKRSFHNAYQ